jgi:hypothetical protein
LNKIFVWDSYSDQPYPIKDSVYKKSMRKKNLLDILGYWVNIVIFPLAVIISKFLPSHKQSAKNFFGMGVNLDKGNAQIKLLDELGIDDLLIRFYLRDMDKINDYVEFIKKFKNKNIMINIIQDRVHIDDLDLLKKDIDIVFTRFKMIKQFQIGNAINRSKWGFFSVSEYLKFYKIIQDIRDDKFKEIKLVGSSVIDFEYHVTIRTLFNLSNIKYDAIASLLYVDRRGAPENTQAGFNLIGKIKLLKAINILSFKSNNKIFITETNWPLSNTAPYAPTSEHECVNEDEYAKYMIRYYLLALSSTTVNTVYWHQLISAGYGLVDNRGKRVKKREVFYAYANMIKLLKNRTLLYSYITDKIEITFDNGLKVLWTLKGELTLNNTYESVIDIYGYESLGERIVIDDSPVYLIGQNATL